MKNIFYIIILCGILTGFVLPELELFRPAIPYWIGIMLFLNFLELEPEWRKFFRKELIITVTLSAFIVPQLIYHILSNGLIHEYRTGLFLTAIAPSGVMMLVLARFVPHKDYNLIISNFLATQFGIIIYLPLMVSWTLGETISVDTIHLFYQIAALVLLPYVAGELAKRIFRDTVVGRIKKMGKAVIPVLVYCIIATSIGNAAKEFTWNPSLIRLSVIVLSIYIIQGGLAYLAGMIIGDKSIRNTLAMAASSRNIQLVLGVAVINFPPLVVIPMVLGIIFRHLTNVIWLWIFRK